MKEAELVVVMVALLICILVQGPSSTYADTDPADASAIRIMYSSLNSPSQLTKWTSNGGDPCGESWKGVTCLGSRVTEIEVSGLGLSGSMGYQLDALTAVTNFDISNNNLGSTIPFQLPPSVQRLNLAGNGFNGGLPYSMSQMKSLKYLNVSHNQIQGEVTVDFASLSALSTLDFSYNSITSNLPNSFTSLASMNDMYLQNNQFSGTLDVLANLPLENLNVENNHFTGWIPEQLKSINSLKTNGNSWSSGPAPPPPPGTPPATRPHQTHKSAGHGGPSNDGHNSDSSRKSGIGVGAVAGIVISVLVVGAIAAFFMLKKRSRKSNPDIEKFDNQSFAPLSTQEVQETKSFQASSVSSTKTFEAPVAVNLIPPSIDRHRSFDEDDITSKSILPVKKIDATLINAKSYSIADLQIATESFSVENLIGEGSIGRVYRAQFDHGQVPA